MSSKAIGSTDLNRILRKFSCPSKIGHLLSFGFVCQQALQQNKMSQKVSAASFKNCVGMPLLELADETLVIDALPPMELHLQTGVINRSYKELDVRLQSQKSEDCEASVAGCAA